MNAIQTNQNENGESGKGLLSGQNKKMKIGEFIEILSNNAWRVPLRKTEDIAEIRQDLAVRAVEKFQYYESQGKTVGPALARLIVTDAVNGYRWRGRIYNEVTEKAFEIQEEPEEGSGSIAPPSSRYFRTDLFIEFLDFVEVMNSILDEQKAKVFEALMSGYQQNEIAEMLGLSKGRVSQIVAEVESIARHITA